MCLAIPGKITAIKEGIAEIDYGGASREASVELVPSAKAGDYVLVHAGFAIQILKTEDALATLEEFRKINAAV